MNVVNQLVAVGSPHGDDQVGWRLVDRLGAQVGADTSLVAVSDPLRLHDYLEGRERLIVVDACAAGGAPGTITRLEWPNTLIRFRHSHSTHGLGVADSLQLAEKLDRLPPKVVLFGVEMSQCQPGSSLSDVVERNLDELEEKILLEVQ